MSKAQEITTNRACPSCRDGATSPARTAMARIYQYALAYLCDECREWWMAADDAAHSKSKSEGESCPHHPDPCVAGKVECESGERDRDVRMMQLGGSRS